MNKSDRADSFRQASKAMNDREYARNCACDAVFEPALEKVGSPILTMRQQLRESGDYPDAAPDANPSIHLRKSLINTYSHIAYSVQGAELDWAESQALQANVEEFALAEWPRALVCAENVCTILTFWMLRLCEDVPEEQESAMAAMIEGWRRHASEHTLSGHRTLHLLLSDRMAFGRTRKRLQHAVSHEGLRVPTPVVLELVWSLIVLHAKYWGPCHLLAIQARQRGLASVPELDAWCGLFYDLSEPNINSLHNLVAPCTHVAFKEDDSVSADHNVLEVAQQILCNGFGLVREIEGIFRMARHRSAADLQKTLFRILRTIYQLRRVGL